MFKIGDLLIYNTNNNNCVISYPRKVFGLLVNKENIVPFVLAPDRGSLGKKETYWKIWWIGRGKTSCMIKARSTTYEPEYLLITRIKQGTYRHIKIDRNTKNRK